MRKNLFLTAILMLLLVGSVEAQEYEEVMKDGHAVLCTHPAQAPALSEVLAAFDATLECPASFGQLLENARLRAALGVESVEAWAIWAESSNDDEDTPTSVVEVGAIADLEDVWLRFYMADGQLHADVTVYDEEAEQSSFRLHWDILEPVSENDDDAANVPTQTLYLAIVAAERCTCDNGKGKKGCTDTMCDEMKTCPDAGANGYCCGWEAMIMVPQGESDSLDADSGSDFPPTLPPA